MQEGGNCLKFRNSVSEKVVCSDMLNQFETSRPGSLCRLCLSTERTVRPLDDTWAVYQLLTGAEEMGAVRAVACWECRALLRRALGLRTRARDAQRLLEAADVCAEPVGRCLSRLRVTDTVCIDCAPAPPGDRLALTETVCVDHAPASRAPWALEPARGAPWALEPASGAPWALEPDDIKEPAMLEVKISSDVDFSRIKEFDEVPIVPKLECEDGYDGWADAADAATELAEVAPRPASPPAPTPRKSNRERESRVRGTVRKRRKKAAEVKVEETSDNLRELCTPVWEDRKSARKKREARLRSAKFLTRRHKCLACALALKTDGGLRSHLERLHCQTPGSVACDTCECRARDAATLQVHAERHRVLKCLRCRYSTRSEKHLRRHAATHDRTKQRDPIPCDICGRQLTNRQTFLIHHKLHTSRERYECDHCGRVFTTRTQMFRHLRSHRKSFLCHVCGKTCSDKTYLKCHLLAHADARERQFECGVCHRRYISKFKLLVHTRWHTGERPFSCTLCDKHYREKSQLTQHNRKYHPDSTEPRKKIRTFQRTKSNFVNERFIETKDNSELDKADPDKKSQPHPPTKSDRTKSKEKDLTCSFCGKKFIDKWKLKNHLSVHSDERTYKCDVCDLTFKYQSGLWTHKLVHRGDKYVCSVCGSKFTQKGNLTAHLKIHTDEKPFQCTVCGNRFRMRRNLRNHFKIHSNDVSKLTFDKVEPVKLQDVSILGTAPSVPGSESLK